MKLLLLIGLLLPLVTRAQNGTRTMLLISPDESMQNGVRIMNDVRQDLKANTFVKPYQYTFANRKPKWIGFDESAAPNYERLAMQQIWEQNYGSAVDLMEKAVLQNPKKHGWVGETYLKTLHDYPRAITHLNAYDTLTPNFDDNLGVNPVSYLRGLAYQNMGDEQRALMDFTKAIDPLAEKHGAEWVNYRHFISRAVCYVALNQPEKALLDLEKALKNFNRSALAYYHRGRALRLMNRTAEARTAFQDASFFYKALRVERTGDYLEDEYNPLYEPEIDAAIDQLKPPKP